MLIYESMQVCKYASMLVCKYTHVYIKKNNKKKERGRPYPRLRDFFPSIWLWTITSGSTVQSNRNWTKSAVSVVVEYWVRMGWIVGLSWAAAAQRERTLSLAGSRSLHLVRMWDRVPGVGVRLQVGREQLPGGLVAHQCLSSQHVLYLPDSIRAWQTAREG